jgi:hypothetical protein
MPNAECRMPNCHPVRSETKSKNPEELLFGFATGFLDFARNDNHLFRHSSFGFPSTFDSRASSFLSSIAFAHNEVQTAEHGGHIANQATRQKLRQDAEIHE